MPRVRRAASGTTWLGVGFATGPLYYLYQAWSAMREKDTSARARLSTIVHGALAWPIMLPELIEYSLADAGVLEAASRPAKATTDPGPEKDGA